jgi:hypothetical protein
MRVIPEAGAFYVMDRGYINFERLFIFELQRLPDVLLTTAPANQGLLWNQRECREDPDLDAGNRTETADLSPFFEMPFFSSVRI